MENETRQTLTEKELVDLRRVFVRYWNKNKRWNLADDLAQIGLVQCWLKSDKYKAKKGKKNGRPASRKTFLVRVGINKGKSYLRTVDRRAKKDQELIEKAEIYKKRLFPKVSSRKPSSE